MICIKVEYGLYETRFRICSLVVECSILKQGDPGSIPVGITLKYEFHCLVVMFRVTPTGPWFDPRLECLYTEDTERIIDQSTFGRLDKDLSTSSRGISSLLYMYRMITYKYLFTLRAVHVPHDYV